MIIPSARRMEVDLDTWVVHAVIDPPLVPEDNSYVSLWPIQGELYVGHGDWTDNLGPTSVISVASNGTVTTHFADAPTEAFNKFLEIDGSVYAPLTDPKGSPLGGYMTNRGGEWALIETTLPMIHSFDIGATSHGLWLTGSTRVVGTSNSEPCIFLSSDSGLTWTEMYAGESTYLGRFYGLHVEDDQPFVRASPSGSPVLTSEDGGQSWIEVSRPDLDYALSPSGYRQPDWKRTPTPTSYDLTMRDWVPRVHIPAGEPVVMDGMAYCIAQTGTSLTIYSRPAPAM